LLGGGLRIDVEAVLNQLPGHSWHVRWLPREDVAVSLEEVDERVFLFGSGPAPMVVVLLLSPVPRSIVLTRTSSAG
jgi:hypothetical protein